MAPAAPAGGRRSESAVRAGSVVVCRAGVPPAIPSWACVEGRGCSGIPALVALPLLGAPAHLLAHDVEQAARLLRIEIPVEADPEDALPVPMPALRPVAGMDDHTLEGRPSHQLVDELLGAEELQIARFHGLSPGQEWERASSPSA